MKQFKEMCNILESKIKFTYEPLGEVFSQLSEMIHNNISPVLEETSKNLKIYDFKQAWDRSIDSKKLLLNLNEEDISVIKGLGNMLGKTDMQGQISEIAMTIDFLDTQIKEAEDECHKNQKMYRSLGTIVGLALVIILV